MQDANWTAALTNGLSHEGDGPHLCVLATVDGQMKPMARCMYCREVTEDGQLIFVSDRRTRKDQHLRERPDAEVVFWLESQRTQFRVRGHAVVVGAEMDDYMRQTWWSKISDESRAIFKGLGNGWELAEGEPTKVTADTPMPSTFEMLVLNPEEVEMLVLKEQPQIRRAWSKSGDDWSQSD
ncbi:MAG: pyridoxamine 5'-phosphate oxidase family protein [Planctomycetota bacterium]